MDASDIERRSVEEIGDELADQWEKMVEEAEHDLGDVQVRLRWHQPEIEVIKRAAAGCGISYQAYIRRAAFRRALVDLQAMAGNTTGRR